MFMGSSDIFPLISKSNIVSINDLTLILKIISQCDDKHFTDVTDKNNNYMYF